MVAKPMMSRVLLISAMLVGGTSAVYAQAVDSQDSLQLTLPQVDLIRSFLGRGGHVLSIGETGANLAAGLRSSLLEHPLVKRVDEVRTEDLGPGPQVVIDGEHDLAINLQRVQRGVALHLIRYDYDEERDEVPVLPELAVRLRR